MTLIPLALGFTAILLGTVSMFEPRIVGRRLAGALAVPLILGGGAVSVLALAIKVLA